MATSVVAGTQQFLVDTLHQVGWIIPPYVGGARISHIAAIIDRSVAFGPTELERILSAIYSPEMLASMVVDRYPKTPVIEDFQKIIAESVEAHFLKLDHVAASGLVPVVEGATRRLANRNGVEVKNFSTAPARPRTPAQPGTIENLIAHCKQHVIAKQIGAVGECLSVLESFEMFLSRVLFANTGRQHPFTDGTNRNGMAHAVFADKDFGSPLNFYKVITAVNVLTWMSALYYGGSGFVPNETPQSVEHARYYQLLSNIASQERPKP